MSCYENCYVSPKICWDIMVAFIVAVNILMILRPDMVCCILNFQPYCLCLLEFKLQPHSPFYCLHDSCLDLYCVRESWDLFPSSLERGLTTGFKRLSIDGSWIAFLISRPNHGSIWSLLNLLFLRAIVPSFWLISWVSHGGSIAPCLIYWFLKLAVVQESLGYAATTKKSANLRGLKKLHHHAMSPSWIITRGAHYIIQGPGGWRFQLKMCL